MRKSFITLAVTAALVISNITPAFAAYIVAPPETEGATYERYVWSVEEEQRQKDRLVNTYAENIKATTPENSVERLNAVVKAVADYCPTITTNTVGIEQQWETDTYSYGTLEGYVSLLCRSVGLDMTEVVSMRDHTGYAVNSCTIRDTIYYVDAFRYVEISGTEGLATTNHGSYYKTNEQLAAETKELTKDSPNEFTTNNGQVIHVTK